MALLDKCPSATFWQKFLQVHIEHVCKQSLTYIWHATICATLHPSSTIELSAFGMLIERLYNFASSRSPDLPVIVDLDAMPGNNWTNTLAARTTEQHFGTNLNTHTLLCHAFLFIQ